MEENKTKSVTVPIIISLSLFTASLTPNYNNFVENVWVSASGNGVSVRLKDAKVGQIVGWLVIAKA